MTKFEEEAIKEAKKSKVIANSYAGEFTASDIGLNIKLGRATHNFPWLEFAKNWHSDEEFQAEKDARKKEYEIHQDIYSKTAKELNKAELEIADLKSQLQQQALPVIPDYVAQLVDYTVKVQHTIPSDIIGYFYFRNEQFSIEDMNLPNDILDLEKLSEYFKIGLHRFEFERACIIGYKSQLFYLKNKLTGMYLAYDGMNDLYEVWETKAHKFTEQEIGSMNTGSYEQIEVKE